MLQCHGCYCVIIEYVLLCDVRTLCVMLGCYVCYGVMLKLFVLQCDVKILCLLTLECYVYYCVC